MGSSTFSKHDLKMIETSWSFVKDKKTLGLNTMIRLFETSEEIKQMFSFTTTHTTPTNTTNNNRLIYHANQVIKSFDTIIILLTLSKNNNNNNDNRKKIDLIELGKLHYHAGIKKEYFKVNFCIFIFCLSILCFILIIDI